MLILLCTLPVFVQCKVTISKFHSYNFAQNKATCLIINELDRSLYVQAAHATTKPHKPCFSLYSAI
nr:MAG TPA: hypothetical protein [Crassvirales sp.]